MKTGPHGGSNQSIMYVLCLIILLLEVLANDAIRILRNTVDVSVLKPVGGAHLTNVSDSVITNDLSFCFRFHLKVLGGHEYKAQLLMIEDWRDTNDDPDFRLLWFPAKYPETFFGFGYPRNHDSYGSYLLKDPVKDTYQIFTPFRWSHLCFSYEKSTSYIRMVKVKTIENYNFNLYLNFVA